MLLPSWCFHTRLQHVFLKPRAWSSRKAGLLFGRYETAPHSRLTQTCPVDNCSNAWSSLASNVVYLLPQPHRWGFFCPVLTVIKAGGLPGGSMPQSVHRGKLLRRLRSALSLFLSLNAPCTRNSGAKSIVLRLRRGRQLGNRRMHSARVARVASWPAPTSCSISGCPIAPVGHLPQRPFHVTLDASASG